MEEVSSTEHFMDGVFPRKQAAKVEHFQDEVFSRKQAAAFLGVSLVTLDAYNIPRTKMRKLVFYRKSAIFKWLEKNEKRPKPKKEEKNDNTARVSH